MTTNAVHKDGPVSAAPLLSGTLQGRYMLPDTSEHVCEVMGLTAAGAYFSSRNIPPPGQQIVAYIEDLGRVEAVTGEATEGGFAVEFVLKGSRRERIETRLRWLIERMEGKGGIESRRHARHEPQRSTSQITLPDGRSYACEVVDISLSGAALKVDVMPALGTYVMLGRMRGRIVRYIESGVALEFVQPPESSGDAIRH